MQHLTLSRTGCVLVLALLGGCATTERPHLATPVPTTEGCQIRAGSALPEGNVSAGFGGVQVAAAGAAVTALGTCPEKLHAFVRSPGGGWVCYGTPEQCADAIAAIPVTLPASEYQALQRRALGVEL